ncbi:hypothetical protein J1N35_020834 [Gossypium stocksii]|uniref:Uncharacterized protein n=1 Tax=Gossypium stocksii TaxID=47602 RepID=A0A9D3VDI5_9ROSI|nr:hypothetical protein J1N35_020834 [Gossypium stocksii]
MYHLGLQLDDYLHEFYHIETYKSVYSFPMQPHDWEKTGVKLVLPAIERKMIGRPKKNRMTIKDEPKKLKSSHLSRKGLTMKLTGVEGRPEAALVKPVAEAALVKPVAEAALVKPVAEAAPTSPNPFYLS